jgi:hypothetical protein
MNQPSEFGSIVVHSQILGLFWGPKYRELFAIFVSNRLKTKTTSPIQVGKGSGTASNISKNKGASMQLSLYQNVSISSIPSSIGADKFAAQQINSGKLS